MAVENKIRIIPPKKLTEKVELSLYGMDVGKIVGFLNHSRVFFEKQGNDDLAQAALDLRNELLDQVCEDN